MVYIQGNELLTHWCTRADFQPVTCLNETQAGYVQDKLSSGISKVVERLTLEITRNDELKYYKSKAAQLRFPTF